MAEPLVPSKAARTVAIVGTAGRGADAGKIDARLFEKMVSEAANIIERRFGLRASDVVLVSGGAAGADHAAVALWLSRNRDTHGSPTTVTASGFAGLRLFLPCPVVNELEPAPFGRLRGGADAAGATMNRY